MFEVSAEVKFQVALLLFLAELVLVRAFDLASALLLVSAAVLVSF